MALTAHAAELPSSDWNRYKQAFIQEGRIVDVGNQGISHSEGQGYGMLLAVAADDREVFEQIWHWTRKNLQREDKLFGWRWAPNGEPHVQDWNNATDGDLLLAWALASGAERWKRPEWRDEARVIAQRIRTSLLHDAPFGPALLPGQTGFKTEAGLAFNPSYWVFPAFKALDRIDPDPGWKSLTASGLALLSLARFGPHQLPPDWVVLHNDQRLGLADHPSRRRMGFEAIRIPLYLCWAGLKDPILLQGFLQAWPNTQAPAWFDLFNQDRAAYPLGLAQASIRQLVASCMASQRPTTPITVEPKDYYGSTLALLARVALTEAGQFK